MPGPWQRIESIYHATLERAPEERPRFLEEVCGDDDGLRQEVESLLIHEPDAAEFLETPMAYSPAETPDENKTVPRRLVEYLLAKRTLQAAVVLPISVLAFFIAENRNRTIAELVGINRGYFYWIAAAALCLKFRHKIRIWVERTFFRTHGS